MNILQLLKNSINTLYVKYIGEDQNENLPIYYIGGSQILPPPLEQEEEEEVLQKLSNGDESVRKILVERNLRLVVYIAKKFENTGVGLEDLISIGTIGLMKAINTFNTDKNIKLATIINSISIIIIINLFSFLIDFIGLIEYFSD